MVKATRRGARAAQSTRVLVGRFGEEPRTITIRGVATVGAVLDAAEIEVESAEHIWLNGARATNAMRVKTGDILSVVLPREGGQ